MNDPEKPKRSESFWVKDAKSERLVTILFIICIGCSVILMIIGPRALGL